MVEKIKIRDEISLNGLGAAVFSTFNLNLQFFEQVILPRLRNQGCRMVLVLVDEGQFQAALTNEGYEPTHLGRSWAVLPIHASGAFHPKFALLLGKKESRLLVGSHNLTYAGYGRNRENTLVWSTQGKASDVRPLQDVWKFVKEWTSEQPSGAQALIQLIEGEWSWLHQQGQVLPWTVFGTTRLGPSLWQQIEPMLPTKAMEVIGVGPYFDDGMHFIKELQARWPKAKITFGVQPGKTYIPKKAAQLLPSVRFCDLSGWEPAGAADHLIHAKSFIVVETPGRGVLVTGSANPSKPAWLEAPSKRNAEMVVVQSFEKIARIPFVSDIASIRDLPELSKEGWKATSDAWEQLKERTSDGHLPSAIAWRVGRTISVFGLSSSLPSTDKFSLKAFGTVHPLDNPRSENDGSLRFEVPKDVSLDDFRKLIHTSRNHSYNIPILHQELLLEAATRTTSMQGMKAALLGFDDDLVGLEEHLKVIEKVIDDHAEAQQDSGVSAHRANAKGTSEESNKKFEGPRVIPLHELVRSRHPRRLKASDTLAMLIDSLYYRLGQGLQSAIQVPSELRDVSVVDEDKILPMTPPVQDVSPEEQGLRNIKIQKRVRGLLSRMIRQAKKSIETGLGHSARVEQAAAVLAVVKHLARLQDRHEISGASFINPMDLQWFISEFSPLLFFPGNGIICKAIEQNSGESFEELSLMLALLLWASQFSGLGVHSHLPNTDDSGPDELDSLRRDLMDETILLHTLIAAVKDEVALTLIKGQEASHDFRQWFSAHYIWAGKVDKAIASAGALPRGRSVHRGDLGLFQDQGKWTPSMVIDAPPGKVRVHDVGRDTFRTLLKPYFVAIPWDRSRWYYQD